MNLIYCCCFFQEGYIDLLLLLLKSIDMYANLKNTDLLVLTSSKFQELIEQRLNLSVYKSLKFFNIEANSLYQACYSRLRIFEYPDIQNYDKILYVDIDVLCMNDLNQIFVGNLQNKIYVVEENGSRKWHYFLYTKQEICKLPTKSFSSGIILFKNNSILKNFFQKVLNHIINHINAGKIMPSSVDQPFFIYNAYQSDMYDNQWLNKFVSMWSDINLSEQVNSKNFNDKKLIHFVGTGTGGYAIKVQKLTECLDFLTRKS